MHSMIFLILNIIVFPIHVALFLLQLGSRKFLYVRKFQERLTVQIREFFVPKVLQTSPEQEVKFEDLRPSQRGVALTPQQWHELKALVERIDKDLQTAASAPSTAAAPAPPPANAPAQN